MDEVWYMSESPFLKSVEDFMLVQRYSRRTISTYLYWIKYFILYSGKRHPSQLHDEDIIRFLTFLAVERNVSAGTQALALNAIVFLKTKFLGQTVGDLSSFSPARKPRKLPVVLTSKEVAELLSQLEGVSYLMAALLYGSGLRRIELVRLRVKDIDLDYKQVRVMFGKGGKHRIVTLAEELLTGLRHQIKQVALILENDCGIPEFSGAWMPEALARKYPAACRSLAWQYLFPASRLSVDPASGLIRRHHYDENNVNKMVKQAARNAGIGK